MAMFNFAKANKKKSLKDKTRFYLHEMLATYREEKVPLCYNPRHLRKFVKEKYYERPVFK